MKPVRIQLSRKKGWRMPEGAVKVDRSTKWGNPWSPKNFKILTYNIKTGGITGSRNASIPECVQAFREYLSEPEIAEFVQEIKTELRGKNLACWCKPGDDCHADVLLEIANA
jgi:hypothetical protein